MQFGIPNMPQQQYQRLKVLSDQGFPTKRVHGWFHGVRKVGSQARHEGYTAQRGALLLVRTCYSTSSVPGSTAR